MGSYAKKWLNKHRESSSGKCFQSSREYFQSSISTWECFQFTDREYFQSSAEYFQSSGECFQSIDREYFQSRGPA